LIKRKQKMADSKSKNEQTADVAASASAAGAASSGSRASMGIRLMPVDNSDQPVVANYTSLNVAPGMVFIDFGFLEPAMLAAIPRVARGGGKLPERVNGRLAVRVALGADTLRNLKQQIDALVAAGRRGAAAGDKK
jgi:hypothetical protein